MRAAAAAALVLLVLAATGCVRYVETYSVSFRSRNGLELASGNIMLSSPLPASGTILGYYKIQLKNALPTTKDIELFNQLFKGRETGRVEWVLGSMGATPSKFDFMPQNSDSNIIGKAMQVAKGYWRGRWSSVLFTGVYEGGEIDIARINIARK
jgi:hypothetical protein